MGAAVFKYRPTSEEVTSALDRIIAAEQVCPKHLIVDQGPEFDSPHFKDVWCEAKNIQYRFGAVGRHGSLAVVERFHRTMKELLRLIVVPEDQSRFEHEVACIIDWYKARYWGHPLI
jgi:transposase InsO family protein